MIRNVDLEPLVCAEGLTCNPNNLQLHGFYLLFKGYLLLNCRLLEPQVGSAVNWDLGFYH